MNNDEYLHFVDRACDGMVSAPSKNVVPIEIGRDLLLAASEEG